MVKGTRRAGNEDLFVGNIYMPPESKSTVNVIQQRFGDVATDVQKKYRRQGEVMLVRYFNARVLWGREKEHKWSRNAEVS